METESRQASPTVFPLYQEPGRKEYQNQAKLRILFSEHPAFHGRNGNWRSMDLSFALGNRLLGILNEKQHREREYNEKVGWYHKTDFEISATIGGKDFHHEGRFDIGDGDSDLIAHIQNFYQDCLSPNSLFHSYWKEKGEEHYHEQMEHVHSALDTLIPFLKKHSQLTQKDEALLSEILGTEKEWFGKAGETEQAGPEKENIEGTVPEKVDAEPEEKTAIDKSQAANYRIMPGEETAGKGFAPKEKFRQNVEAIRTLGKIEGEHRIATPEEQGILAKYVGWGGLSDAFDGTKANWASEFKELKGLLSPEEYASARESTLNAHYTSPVIIKSIYDAIGRMGFSKGNILEPAVGMGNFFGMLPENMQGSRLYGVELDGLAGRIARQLYPNADVKITGFEKTGYPNDFFDVAVGNVPFGQYKVVDKAYDRHNFLIHDYFFGATRS